LVEKVLQITILVFEPPGFAKKVGADAGAWVARGEFF
jgi:hypothetical protein